MTPEEFEKIAAAQGYDAAKSITFAANSRAEEHTHDQRSFVSVVAGTFILNTPDGAASYLPGETCVLDAHVPHAEEAGPEGATILVART